MKKQLRAHGLEMLAVVALALTGLTVAGYILAHQRVRFPWDKTYTIVAELSSSQAVTPGQGQVVAVAGVTVGEVGKVRLHEGRARVEMIIERDRLSAVHAGARVLLRPKTGLQDMALQLDPGRRSRPKLDDGDVITVDATRTNVNLDEVLAGLDADARTYLRLLVAGGGRGMQDRGRTLRSIFRAGAPTLRQTRRVAGALAARDDELRRVVRDLRLLAGAAATKDRDLVTLVDAGNATLQTVAAHDDDVRAALDRLPGTLRATRTALAEVRPFARRLGPALDALGPATTDLHRALPEIDPLLRDGRPAARRIRRLIPDALPVAADLGPTLRDLRAVTPDLRRAFDVLTYVVNELGHNPEGPEEGYLFWLTWFAHNAASILSVDDAHGVAWRGALLTSCSSYGVLSDTAPLVAAASTAPNCPQDVTADGDTP